MSEGRVPAPELSRTPWSDLGLLLVSLIWGLTFPMIRLAITEGASPMVFVATRFGLATLLLAPFAVRGVRAHRSALVSPALILGLALGAGYALQTYGLTMTTASKSAFITGSSVVMVPFLDRVLRSTPLRASALVGAALALVGVSLLSGVRGLAELGSFGSGDALTVAAAACFALYVVLLQDRLVGLDRVALLGSHLLVVTVAALLLAPLVEEPRLEWTGPVIGAIVFCAVFATAVSGLLHLACQARTTPARAAVIFAMEPVFAALFAALLLGEALGSRATVGGALVILGVLATDLAPLLRPVRRGRAPSAKPSLPNPRAPPT